MWNDAIAGDCGFDQTVQFLRGDGRTQRNENFSIIEGKQETARKKFRGQERYTEGKKEVKKARKKKSKEGKKEN